MGAKKQQAKHWANSRYDNPHKTTLSLFIARAAMLGDAGALHIFILERMYA